MLLGRLSLYTFNSQQLQQTIHKKNENHYNEVSEAWKNHIWISQSLISPYTIRLNEKEGIDKKFENI